MKPKIKVVWVLCKSDGFVWEVHRTRIMAEWARSYWKKHDEQLLVRRVEVKHG